MKPIAVATPKAKLIPLGPAAGLTRSINRSSKKIKKAQGLCERIIPIAALKIIPSSLLKSASLNQPSCIWSVACILARLAYTEFSPRWIDQKYSVRFLLINCCNILLGVLVSAVPELSVNDSEVRNKGADMHQTALIVLLHSLRNMSCSTTKIPYLSPIEAAHPFRLASGCFLLISMYESTTPTCVS